MKFKSRKGFTLIELLSVVLIIAILACISIPLYNRIILKSRSAEVNNLLTLVRTRQAQNFARERRYETSFEDSILSQITTDAAAEVNNGAFKTVDEDYELELIDDGTHRCVIGRYKPQGSAQGTANFAFAISYDMSGLGCSDSETQAAQGNPDTTQYTRRICASFGDIVGTVSDVCQGIVLQGMDIHVGQCCQGYEYWDIQTGKCRTIPGINLNNHYVDGNGDSCLQCAYQSDENGQPILRVVDQTTGYPLEPQHYNRVFSCNDPQAAVVGATVDENGYYQCNSAHYEVWSNEKCDWVCPTDRTDICPPDQIFNTNTCTCMCKFGEQCGCDPTQQPVDASQHAIEGNQHCECLAPSSEVRWVADDQPCLCIGRNAFGESDGERALEYPYEHCSCASGRSPVFFGTITDASTSRQQRVLSTVAPNLQNYASDEEANLHEAACCANNDVWHAVDLHEFGHDACCPYTDSYKLAGVAQEPVHIAFDTASRECCGESVPFFNFEAKDSLKDPNEQYSLRPFGPIAANLCHTCEVLTNAYDSEYGCYECPGKTFSNWNGSVAVCACPTGTDIPEGSTIGLTTTEEDCQCTKLNTHWDPDVSYENDATTRTAWHRNNGACKCNSGYTDTYWGLELDDDGSGTATVSDINGFCCPNNESINYTTSSHLSGELACCPYADYKRDGAVQDPVHTQFNTDTLNCCGLEVPFFNQEANSDLRDPNYSARLIGRQLNTDAYHTDSDTIDAISANLCHKCEKLTDAYNTNQGCYQCAGITFTIWDSASNISSCKCPTGTTGTPSTPWDADSTKSDCKCIKDNAEWNESVNYQEVAGEGLVAATAWHKNNGACKCKAGYTDVVWGVQMGIDENKKVSSANGFCCPTEEYTTSVYNDSNDVVDGQKACCPSGRAFFHQTTYASNTCGVCKDQRDTSLDGTSKTCQPCPGNMVPIFDTDAGYSKCYCPHGMQPKPGKQDGIATDEDICECKLDHATWSAPNNWLDKYINKFVMDHEDTEMPATWDEVNGYCSCDTNYGLARYGKVTSPYVPTDNIPNTGALTESPAEEQGTGYCCSKSPQRWWQTVGLTPVRDFCCDAGFNNEGARSHCCPSDMPNFFSLDEVKETEYNGLTLGTIGRSNLPKETEEGRLTRGACSPCDEPYQTYTNNACSDCPTPKVPVWNNGDAEGNNGYSTCECPKGTANEKPTWWQSFLTWLGYELDDLGCYCDIPGTTWHDTADSDGYHCQCQKGNLTQSHQDGTYACCPKDTVIAGAGGLDGEYYDSHYCCPKGREYYYDGEGEDGCHICPPERPYYWLVQGEEPESEPSTLTQEDVTKFCHACPTDRPYQYGTTCCPNQISSDPDTVYGINITGVGFRCSICPGGDCSGEEGGLACIQNGSGATASAQWNETTAQYECVCSNGSTYIEGYGCQCASQCNTYINPNSYSWQYSGYDVIGCSGCGERREWNDDDCCENNVSCCVCKEGYKQTDYSSYSYMEENQSCDYHASASLYLNSCCATSDIVDAGSNKKACCGAGVDFNLSKNSCCPSFAPNYSSDYGGGVGAVCYKCNSTQYWNNGQCETCGQRDGGVIDPLAELSAWNDCKGAYTQCGCKLGSLSGAGNGIGYKGTNIQGTSYCKCLNEGERYLTTDGYLTHALYLVGEDNSGKACQTCPLGSSYGNRGYKNGVNYGYGCACDSSLHLDKVPEGGKCVCESGYYLMTADYQRCNTYDGTDCICRACPSNTTATQTGCTCTDPSEGPFYYNQDGVSCSPFNGTTCICGECADGMHSTGEGCACDNGSLMTDLYHSCSPYDGTSCKCRTCPTGMTSDGHGGCTCDTGYVYLRASGASCSESQYDGSDCICRQCSSFNGAVWDAGAQKCRKCPNNQIWDTTTETCRSCSFTEEVDDLSWSTAYAAFTQCECNSPYTDDGVVASTIPGNACYCPSNQYWSQTSDYLPSSTGASDQGTCRSCPTGTTWNTQLFISGNDDHSQAPCECGENEYFDTSTGTCKCNDDYIRMNDSLQASSSGTCRKCSDYPNMQWNSQEGKCECSGSSHFMKADFTGCGAYNSTTGCQCRTCPTGRGAWAAMYNPGDQTYSCACVGANKHAYSVSANNLLRACTAGDATCYCGACPNNTQWCSDSQRCSCDQSYYSNYRLSTNIVVNLVESSDADYKQTVFVPSNGGNIFARTAYCEYTCSKDTGSFPVIEQIQGSSSSALVCAATCTNPQDGEEPKCSESILCKSSSQNSNSWCNCSPVD